VAWIGGDEGAFKSLYTHYADPLFSFGLRYTPDQDIVKDAIHDLFIDLHKYRRSLARDVNVKGYLFASLKRKISSALKKQNKEAEYENSDLSFHISYSKEDSIIDDESQAELVRRLQNELNALPDRQREVLYLRYNAELEYEEIAVLMSITVATCRTLVHRAVKQLREKIDSRSFSYILLLMFNKVKTPR
jgi:RNA polymerase sigma factor (sigma-70 family)